MEVKRKLFYWLDISNFLYIIVLLILAAVSIATLTGQNGILTQANNARDLTNRANVREQVQIDILGEQMKNTNGDLTQEQLRKVLGKYFEDVPATEKELEKELKDPNYSLKAKDEYGDVELKVSELYNGSLAKKEIDPKNLQPGEKAPSTIKHNYTDGKGDKATIPEGFKVSEESTEQNVDTGLVVIAPDESEFVWVPVEKAIATSSPDEPTDVTTEKPMAVKIGEDDYRGVLYEFSGSGESTTSSIISGCTTTNFNGNTGNREPAYLTDSSYADAKAEYNKGRVTEDGLKREYKEMIESVEQYRGFYVGRYETSINGSNVASKTGQAPMSAKDYDGQRWYGMYEKQKNYASIVKIEENSEKTLDKIVESSMIWGSQYDAMLNWILKGSDKDKVTANSTKTKERTTGTSTDIMNKIYDLGNNLREWTLEARNSVNRVYRGDYYLSYSSPSSRNSSQSYPAYATNDLGSRLTLYIK